MSKNEELSWKLWENDHFWGYRFWWISENTSNWPRKRCGELLRGKTSWLSNFFWGSWSIDPINYRYEIHGILIFSIISSIIGENVESYFHEISEISIISKCCMLSNYINYWKRATPCKLPATPTQIADGTKSWPLCKQTNFLELRLPVSYQLPYTPDCMQRTSRFSNFGMKPPVENAPHLQFRYPIRRCTDTWTRWREHRTYPQVDSCDVAPGAVSKRKLDESES